MSIEEKAIELYEAMFYKIPNLKSVKEHDKAAIDCALVAVEHLRELDVNDAFWDNVKKELKKLY